MRRRSLLVLAAVGVVSSAGACSSRPRVPGGWKRAAAGPAAFNVPESWQEVTVPQDAEISWDWVMQDTPTYDDESTTCRLLTMTQGPGAVLRNPPADDTRLLAEYLSASRLFGDGTAVGVNGSPYQVEGAPDELWRMDYRTAFGSEDTEDHDHVFVPQDKGKPEIAVIGLTGPGITEDILTTFTAPLPPSAPDPAHRLDHRCRRLPGPGGHRDALDQGAADRQGRRRSVRTRARRKLISHDWRGNAQGLHHGRRRNRRF